MRGSPTPTRRPPGGWRKGAIVRCAVCAGWLLAGWLAGGKSDQPGNLAAGWLQACSWFLYAISGQPAIQPNVSQRAKGASR